MRILFSAAAVVALGTGLPAQLISTIAAGSTQTTVTSQLSSRRNVAAAPDGLLWTYVREIDTVTDDRSLELYASADGGATWNHFPPGATPTTGDAACSIAFGPDCNLLHVAWHAHDGTGLYDAYYATFDTTSAQWSAPPHRLTTATGPNDQYYSADLEITPKGTVVVVIQTHRSPPSTWNRGWASGLHVMPRGGTFSAVQQINTDYSGILTDAQAIGEVVHFTFRTATGGYGIRYRAYDTEAMQFTTSADVQIELGTSNLACTAADSNGGLYSLYGVGGSTAGTGEIRVAYGAPGAYGTWAIQPLAADPDLIRGNVSYYSYTLATLDGGLVAAFYSKRTGEQHDTLYYRLLADGVLLTPETIVMQTAIADRFRHLSGLRSTQSTNEASLVVESLAAIHPGRQIDFVRLADRGRVVNYGLGCQGSLAAVPRIAVPALPAAGQTMGVELDDLPATQQGVLWFGFACLPQAIPLDVAGLPGCALFQTTPVSVPYASDGNGSAQIGVGIPASTTLTQVPITMQSLVLAPGANALGALMTGNVMAWLP